MHDLDTINVFKIFSDVPNRFNNARTHVVETMFSRFSLQFQIVSNTGWMHALETLFFFFSAVPNRFKYGLDACFRDVVLLFLCSSKSFQIPQNASFKDLVFIFVKSVNLNILLLILFHVA